MADKVRELTAEELKAVSGGNKEASWNVMGVSFSVSESPGGTVIGTVSTPKGKTMVFVS